MEQSKKEYAVLGVPSESVCMRIKKLMTALASEFDGPDFDPHVTVMGLIKMTEHDAVTRFNGACYGVKSYEAVVEKVASGTSFFQCVFLLICPTPQVLDTSSHVCRHFGYKSSTPYMPHLSLLYQDLSEEEKKKAVERANELDDSIGSLSFQISSLALYEIETGDKTLKSWKKVAERSLATN